MLTITINGHEEKLNIGCRTFISLDVLLKTLSANDSAVTLNGKKISLNNIASTIVNGGDKLTLPSLDR
jgi:sulfur carrier protein ThiS